VKSSPPEARLTTFNSPAHHDPYLALRFRDYRLLVTGNWIAMVGVQMVSLAVGWDLYERTNSALVLGFVGLVQVLPVLAFSLIAGHVADHYNRIKVVVASQTVLVAGSLCLTALAYWHGPLAGIFACLLVMGIGTAFNGPAARTLPTVVVPEYAFENAATWSSSVTQLAFVVGPALGGLVIAVSGGPTYVYVLNSLAAVTYVVLLLLINREVGTVRAEGSPREPLTRRSFGEGIDFLRRTPIILAVITLDLFAVLLGGATTLLPVFARDVLYVGPTGLGWLRAAPSIGAVGMALFLAHRPPMRRAGPALLLAVASFGVATILFGLSRSFWFSLLALFVLGAMDNISVVVRSTLTLVRTPNAMRGRVAAINGLCISASNQLGGFESGVTAQLFGPVWSVVGGGIGTIVVALLAAGIWPELRALDSMREPERESAVDAAPQANVAS
jgi:MFS family permease